jgi:hypothetical protein
VLQQNDILFAHMALLAAHGLSPAARRVGFAIIEHYNKKTGQCDPSIERIARMLGLGRSVVAGATAELCKVDKDTNEPLGMFIRVTHGGRSHRTAYVPLWERFHEIIDDWDLRMKDGSAPSNIRKTGRSTSEKSDVNSPKNRTQTDRRNRQKKPKAAVSLSERGGEQPPPSRQRQGSKGLRNEGASPQRQGFLVHAIAGGKGASHADAAEAAAMRRIIDPARKHNAALAYRIDTEATPEMLAQASAAEVARRGSGLQHLVDALDEQARRMRLAAIGQGPPAPEAGPSERPPSAGKGGPGISVCEVNFIGKAN